MSGKLSVQDDFNVKFFPVIHLLTGPPGLIRNGGIWKGIKSSLKNVYSPPSFMVQALHFTNYTLSQGAWEDWGLDGFDNGRLGRELEKTFGNHRDVFLDSGGFQLLHSDKIDLSKWGMKVRREDILSFQLKFRPTRVASLDSPISYNATSGQAAEEQRISIDNAVWLAESIGDQADMPIPYLAVHGRNPEEIGHYLNLFETSLPSRFLRKGRYGLALGSQVPLTRLPSLIHSNTRTVLNWMDKNCGEDTPLHIFGVGDSIIGSALASNKPRREISYDNSTYAQAAFRLKTFDPVTSSYIPWSPSHMPDCSCYACERLRLLGKDSLNEMMQSPAYRTHQFQGENINRSDIIAYIALHNMKWWKSRMMPWHNFSSQSVTSPKHFNSKVKKMSDYSFPLRQFKPRSPNLLVLPCSKKRPYSESQSHKRVKKYLLEAGFEEGRDYDRITLSGLYGPVHWKDEMKPEILSYDFQLGSTVNQEHLVKLRFTLGTVLNVIRKKYYSMIGFLPLPVYAKTFGPVLLSFNGVIARKFDELNSYL